MEKLGDLLCQLRKYTKKSLRKVASEANISHTYLSTLEKGVDPRTNKPRKPSPDTLKKLALYYQTPLRNFYSILGFDTFYEDNDIIIDLMESDYPIGFSIDENNMKVKVENSAQKSKIKKVNIYDFIQTCKEREIEFFYKDSKLSSEDIDEVLHFIENKLIK